MPDRKFTAEDRATCERKDCFSYAEARRIAKRIRRFTDDVVRPYHCKSCHAWHVGGDYEAPLRRAERKLRKRGRK